MSQKKLNEDKDDTKKVKGRIRKQFSKDGCPAYLANSIVDWFYNAPTRPGVSGPITDKLYFSKKYRLKKCFMVIGLYMVFFIGVPLWWFFKWQVRQMNVWSGFKFIEFIIAIVLLLIVPFIFMLKLEKLEKGNPSDELGIQCFMNNLEDNGIIDLNMLEMTISQLSYIYPSSKYEINIYKFWNLFMKIVAPIGLIVAALSLEDKAEVVELFLELLGLYFLMWFVARILHEKETTLLVNNKQVKLREYRKKLFEVEILWKHQQIHAELDNDESINSDEFIKTLRSIDDKLPKVNKTSQKRTRRR
ncbi:hypothetical protein [Lactiplantibacillus plantarum]|uniref:hypothetical protein n=1 Tax=Lactiplantibacillus plantarum TaxID=1590 RepID=UPI00195CBDF4|nr:hypothetical protein [Lactiplantibacillus plantarum]QRQ96740.1 hypothetical protein Lp900_00499 [Lactiplantibacillus plantarum]